MSFYIPSLWVVWAVDKLTTILNLLSLAYILRIVSCDICSLPKYLPVRRHNRNDFIFKAFHSFSNFSLQLGIHPVWNCSLRIPLQLGVMQLSVLRSFFVIYSKLSSWIDVCVWILARRWNVLTKRRFIKIWTLKYVVLLGDFVKLTRGLRALFLFLDL